MLNLPREPHRREWAVSSCPAETRGLKSAVSVPLPHGRGSETARNDELREPSRARRQAVSRRPPGPFGRAAAILALLCAAAHAQTAHVTAVRFWSLGDVTRIAVEATGEFSFRSDRLPNPDRLFFDLPGTRPELEKKGVNVIPVHDQFVRQIRVAETQHGVTRIVLDLATASSFTTEMLANPDRLIIELRAPGTTARKNEADRATAAPERPLAAPLPVTTVRQFTPPLPVRRATPPSIPPRFDQPPAVAAAAPRDNPVIAARFDLPPAPAATASAPAVPAAVHATDRPAPVVQAEAIPPPPPQTAPARSSDIAYPARRNASGDRSMIRVLGLKVNRIVIDAGHGGHDNGTTGPTGLREKDLVLDVAKRLGALVEERMGSQVVYTRSDDTFVPLEQRTAIANAQQADLFISIHANSSPVPSASGVETYYLNFTTAKDALDLATRENAESAMTINDLQDVLQKIALKDKVDESREFAQRVQTALIASGGRAARARDRGVRKAPFVVLIGATMPSVLAEIGFVSNPQDERQLKRPETRQKIAEALYKGLSQYAATLSHFQVATTKR